MTLWFHYILWHFLWRCGFILFCDTFMTLWFHSILWHFYDVVVSLYFVTLLWRCGFILFCDTRMTLWFHSILRRKMIAPHSLWPFYDVTVVTTVLWYFYVRAAAQYWAVSRNFATQIQGLASNSSSRFSWMEGLRGRRTNHWESYSGVSKLPVPSVSSMFSASRAASGGKPLFGQTKLQTPMVLLKHNVCLCASADRFTHNCETP